MDSQCTEASGLAQSVWLRAVLFIKLTCCATGVVATIFLLMKQGVSLLVHPNAKVLYSIHVFWTVYIFVFYFISYTFDAIRLQTHHNSPCDLLISMKIAFPLRAIPVLGVMTQSFTMCAFAIERAIATFFSDTYETITKPWIGISFGLICLLVAVLLQLFLVVLPINWNQLSPMTAIKTTENEANYMFYLSSYTIVEVITICTFSLTLIEHSYRIRKSRREGGRLGNKYQVKENKFIIKILLPCFFLHFLPNFFPIAALRLYPILHIESIDYAAWLEMWLQVHMHSLIFPVFVEFWLYFRRRNSVIDVNDSAKHFQQLNNIFNR